MTRPQSLVGLVVYLVTLYARRRPGWALGVAVTVVVAAALVWPRAGGPRTGEPVQPAVFPDGFGALVGTGAARRVVAYDRAGARVAETPVRLAAEARMIGTLQGPALGWVEAHKLRVAGLADDGALERPATFGKRVEQLCAGVASNEQRFGIAWLERDGRVWYVHGPKARSTGAPADVVVPASAPVDGADAPAEVAGRTTWCGIASAHDHIALVWRTAAATYLNLCSRKACSSLTTRVPLGEEPLLGFGCVDDGCLFASRDRAGAARLRYVTQRGRVTTWTLAAARADAGIEVVGVADRGFAIAHVGHDGAAAVVRLGVDGELASVWRDAAVMRTPSLAWAADRLLIATGATARVIAVPR